MLQNKMFCFFRTNEPNIKKQLNPRTYECTFLISKKPFYGSYRETDRNQKNFGRNSEPLLTFRQLWHLNLISHLKIAVTYSINFCCSILDNPVRILHSRKKKYCVCVCVYLYKFI